MFSSDEKIAELTHLVREVREYVDLRLELARYDLTAKAIQLLSALCLGVIVLMVVAVAFLFLSFSLVQALHEWLHNESAVVLEHLLRHTNTRTYIEPVALHLDIRRFGHDAVGDALQLIHSVGDVDDANAVGLQLADEGEQVVNLRICQNRGGLVQNQDLGIVVRERLGDLNHLLLGNRQGSDLCLGINGQMEAVQQLLGSAVLLGLVQENTLGGLASDVNIIRNGQVLHQVQFLMYDTDASVLCVLGAIDFDLLTEEFNGTAVLGVDTGQNLHQCGLTGAVFADQCHDFTAAHFELCVIQRVNTGEVFLNALHLQNCFAHSNITFLKSLSMYLPKPFKTYRIIFHISEIFRRKHNVVLMVLLHPTRANRFAYASCTKPKVSIQ